MIHLYIHNRVSKFLLLGLLIGSSAFITVKAQESNSAYFLDGYFYRHQLNPSFTPERNFFSLPVLGNFSLTTRGNVGVSDFLYPYKDPTGKSSLTTFMNSSVGRDQFLKNLSSNNHLGANVDFAILNIGFRAFHGYNTIGINLHSTSRINLPYDLFDFMKSGVTEARKSHYQLKDLQVNTVNYMDISLGHSHQINDHLRIGATAKLLIGLGRMQACFDQMDVNLQDDKWIINANGLLHASLPGSKFKLKDSGEIDDIDFDDLDAASVTDNLGFAVDLGATYKLNDDWAFSMAVLDLGFINWKNSLVGKTNNQPYVFDGFENIGVDDDSDNKNLEDQLDDFGDDLGDLAKFYNDDSQNLLRMIGATINLGAEYTLPVYRKVSFGLLSTTYLNHPYSWTEARLSANYAPAKWFEMTVNGSLSTMGGSCGFMLNLHPVGFNLFFGSDMIVTRFTTDYIPLNNANANFCMGISFPIGKRR